MKKFLSSIGVALVMCSVFVLGWAVGQPDPYKMKINLVIMDEKFLVCDFNEKQCANFTVEQVQYLLLKSGAYESL